MKKKLTLSLTLLFSSLTLTSCVFKPTDKEMYDYAVKQGYKGSFEDWKAVISNNSSSVGVLDTKQEFVTNGDTKYLIITITLTDGSEYVKTINITDPSAPEGEAYPVEDYYGGYYSALTSWTNSEDLINKLHNIISSGTYTPIAYQDPNWETNSYADQDLYDHEALDVVYSADSVEKTATNTGWQREHAFCASLMTNSLTSNAVKFLGRSTDFHNLFAGQSAGNMSRGNKNYGLADKNATGYQDRTINNGQDGYSFDNKNFEPGDKDKGRVARAIYYMTVMYNQDVLDTKNNINMKALRVVDEYVEYDSNNCQFAIGNGKTLFEWAKKDVDLLEYQHNESVYSHKYNGVAQGNRNPFVDYPDLIDYCFGDKKNQPGELKYLQPTYSKLGMNNTDISHYAIKKATRQFDEGATFNSTDLSVAKVYKDLSEVDTTDYTLGNVTVGQTLSKSNTSVQINTSKNTITYPIKVETDKVLAASYNYKLTKESLGGSTLAISGKYSLGDIAWNVTSDNSVTLSNSSAYGVKFGAAGAGSFPTKLTFETDTSISNIKGIYVRGNAASNSSCKVNFKVDGTTVSSGTLSYTSGSTNDVYYELPTTKSGKVTIEIADAKNAFYIQYIAIDK